MNKPLPDDLMLNGRDGNGREEFWIIDMALAGHSALKGCVPAGLLRPSVEGWLPEIRVPALGSRSDPPGPGK